MASLADLFNPSFFMFLGIMVLVIALLIVYFESKMRDQNHKIASMLSLVSTLAEDMNGLKLGLNHLAMTSISMGGGSNNNPSNTPFPTQNLGSMHHNKKSEELIQVSDDEEDEEDDDNEEEEEEEEDDIDGSEDLEDINDIDENSSETNDVDDDVSLRDDNIKVIKLNISQEDSDSEENAFDLDNPDDLADLDGEFEPSDDIPEISEQYAEEVLSLKYDDEVKEEKPLEEPTISEMKLNEAVSELKTISINLGDEHHSEHIDFKKLQLPKLRSIAVEKGLTTSSEAQKLKKPDLLKLLGAE